MPKVNKNSVLLEVDPSVMDNHLLINKEESEVDRIQSLLNYESDGELIHPSPGFCIKTWKENSDEKLFINLCHSEHLPKPNDITDIDLLELIKIAEEEGNSSINYRVPVSIGQAHNEHDKGGRPCEVYDVAVNSTFFSEKVLKSYIFRSFITTMALEGVAEKYNFNIKRDKEPVVLKNCKYMGKIQSQMVQIRKNNGQPDKAPSSQRQKRLIEEITSHNKSNSQKAQSVKAHDLAVSQPYQILIDPESADTKCVQPKYLTINVHIKEPMINSSKALILDVGEDRVLLRTSAPPVKTETSCSVLNSIQPILLDIFLPYNVVQEECKACYNNNNKVVTITMPVAGG